MLSFILALPLASVFVTPVVAYPKHHAARRYENSSYVSTLSTNTAQLFTESMNWLDSYYDAATGYLFHAGSASALRHETRSSAWYSIGLLARNEGSDVSDAMDIITNVIAGQFKDPKDQWCVL